MGYRGKVHERQRARELRAQSWTLADIATELAVSKSSASLWTRDVEFVPKPRNRGHASQRPHPLHVRKLQEIESCRKEAEERFGSLSASELNLFALGLYAGEGSKTGNSVSMANTNPALLHLFVTWLRREFGVEEERLRVKIYLHEGLDLTAATLFWSDVLSIPTDQFRAPYRAVADSTRRLSKHVNGCATVLYHCALTRRRVMAMIEAISSQFAVRDSSVGRAGHC